MSSLDLSPWYVHMHKHDKETPPSLHHLYRVHGVHHVAER
jgi:hypothetical protein